MELSKREMTKLALEALRAVILKKPTGLLRKV